MVSNNICTIILLFILGYIIYILTKPLNNDNANNKLYYNDNYAPYENFTSDGKISDPLINSIKEKQIVTPPPNIIKKIDNPTTITLNSNQSDLFNFEYNDNNLYNYGANMDNTDKNMERSLNYGATLDDAFDNQFPNNNNLTTKETAPTLDLNKGNVSKYNAKDYLPKEINDQWFDTDFSQAKFNINDDKLINTEKYVIGVNTVGQSLKNASYDIRGTVANPKYTVSPWNNSTYEPDYNLKPLC